LSEILPFHILFNTQSPVLNSFSFGHPEFSPPSFTYHGTPAPRHEDNKQDTEI